MNDDEPQLFKDLIKMRDKIESLETCVHRKISRYGMATAADLYALEREVEKWIAEGWQPFGALNLLCAHGTYYSEHIIYAIQPMVKYTIDGTGNKE